MAGNLRWWAEPHAEGSCVRILYQVRVKRVILQVTDVPKQVLTRLEVDATVGRFNNCVDEGTAEDLV